MFAWVAFADTPRNGLGRWPLGTAPAQIDLRVAIAKHLYACKFSFAVSKKYNLRVHENKIQSQAGRARRCWRHRAHHAAAQASDPYHGRSRPLLTYATRLSDALRRNQLACRGPEIFGVGTEGDASERDLTPRTINNCLRHLEIMPSSRSLMSNSFIRPSIVAGSPISINS